MPSLDDHSCCKHGDQEHSRHEEDPQQGLFHQVYEWLHHEKVRRQNRKARKTEATSHATNQNESATEDDSLERRSSNSSENTFSLDKLEKILLQYATTRPNSAGLPHRQPVKKQSRHRLRGLRRGSASESELTDVEGAPPSVEAVLDNTKTLAYTGGAAVEEIADSSASVKQAKDAEAWVIFKTEIVRLVHTLQLKGWRRVPADLAAEIEVVRLSGALTNAVYVVGPPKNLPPPKTDSNSLVSRKPPPKLLLRIYGPQVDHLIDRENELQILRRLGKKNIGPRILGTFQNGRFEEYFEARPLTPKELRMPDTAKQVAKRMRELHDGVELLEEEREGGPMIFKNWEKWVDRCEQVMTWLDKEIESPQNETKAALEPWRRRGYVCGVKWNVFRKAVERYQQWLVASSGGSAEIKRQLVFAHNDTQYGNLLRMEPATESPLLLPANEHKQLIVIDFEYSSANTRGFEFANHFSEWCYNYHDEERPWACNNRTYPTPEQQYHFVSTYLTHRPFNTSGAISPLASPTIRARTSAVIAPLDLDDVSDRPSSRLSQTEQSKEAELDAEVKYLMQQTRMWRAMSSAQWVAWGIVQAKVPGMEEGIAKMLATQNGETVTPPAHADVEEEDEGDFDYLAYAQDRVMFFWGDVLSLNLIKPEELPAPLVEHVKSRLVAY
ncbi:Choline/ethanolamine kinase [Penicillium griseofulvum]|uniref:Choline/ethanolamine kinase n=1 Tax=Penicillium patulum TaxID=5078 RepID=A0A135LBK4_PENPA|nr:Choline/ethanolamine kinase [Penicillium griseofulvum]KXG46349.1 Choline/ethanolamine kinase [Penicillium griseofulvum]